MAAGLFTMSALPTWSAVLGRAITANFEVALMVLLIDHHYSALRMTELATWYRPAP